MNPPPEEITRIMECQQNSWNRADAAGYAQDCDENMSFVNIVGKLFYGREAFEERHSFLFSGIFKGSTLKMTVEIIHFPRPEFAIVDLSCTLNGYQTLPPGVSPHEDGVLHTRLLEVLMQTENGWRVVAYHNVDQKP